MIVSDSQTKAQVRAQAEKEEQPAPLVRPGETFTSITAKISGIVLEQRHPLPWWVAFGIAFLLTMGLFYAVAVLLAVGVGIWGINIPVAWGFAITNFVWWIGIGHAGTLISAILLLLLQKWRNSINRLAEAMTLFAVACAGLFPLLHLGRPWAFFWLLPYPNGMELWPQFRSALVWDVFAVSTYLTVSIFFWYTGLVPDLATLRDRAKNRVAQVIFGLMSFGWRGSAKHWQNYESAYVLMAGLSTPLVLSVHSVVSFDFATAILPGWHSTIFPPYFVAGAVYSGFAMVLNILIPLRKWYGLESVVTEQHLNNMGKVMLATGWMVAYGYIFDMFFAWYSGDIAERYSVINRTTGPYAPIFWLLMLVNVLVPQALWWPSVRRKPVPLFLVALSVNLGMWLERFVIVIVSLNRDFLPSSWRLFIPTGWDWLTLFGSLGLFFALVFLFVRFLPMVTIFEIRELISENEKNSA
ncbi:MAG: polysulfide reductase NrfD [Verrucomicrobia bacterium]|nr:polysulfide reductase NrfD [Verrucomicrobiota bacterium]